MPPIMQRLNALIVRVALAILLCILCANCYPPMKAPLRVKPVTGQELNAEPDTSVIQPGVTTRAEIVHQFAAFDTGWKGEQLFLGRWLRSGFVMNGGRNWGGQMLAVEFDGKGIVNRYHVFSDNEFLRAEDSFLLTSASIQSGDQQLSRDPSLEFILGYPISAQQIAGLSCWAYARVYSPVTTNARNFGLVIHLKEKVYLDSSGGKKHGVTRITLETDVLTVVRVVRFLRMSGQNR